MAPNKMYSDIDNTLNQKSENIEVIDQALFKYLNQIVESGIQFGVNATRGYLRSNSSTIIFCELMAIRLRYNI